MFLIIINVINTYSQFAIVDVADFKLKVAGSNDEDMYYGFAEGDQIIFNFSVAGNKVLKEVDIFEYPSNQNLWIMKQKE